MKKILLTSIALMAFLYGAYAQSFTNLWYYEANATGLVNSANNYNNSVAYNPITGKIYVAYRGTAIYIVDPDDYNTGTKQLNSTAFDLNTKKLAERGTAPLFNEQYKYSKVRVTTDGVIYAVAMQTNGVIAIYRWDSETDTNPTKTEITVTLGRVGDALAVYGTGDNTYLYVGCGSTTTPATTGQYLYVLKVTNKIPALSATIDLSNAKYIPTNIMDIAKGSISVESQNVIWVKSYTVGVHFKRLVLDMTNQNVSSYKNYTTPNINYVFGELFQENGTGFLLAGSSTTAANGGLKFSLNKFSNFGTEPSSLTEVTSAVLPKPDTYVSSSGLGDIAYRKNMDGTTTVFFLVAKNSLGSFQSNMVLPVNISNFSARLYNNQSTLSWQTLSEHNNKGFELLHSTDGQNFQPIAFVGTKATSGNSSGKINYTLIDKNAKSGINYYQLKQIDNDGSSYVLDKTVSVNMSLQVDFIVSPNPATQQITIQNNTTDINGYQYDLRDWSGKKVKSEKAVAHQQALNIALLPNAIYYLVISKNGEQQKTIKIVKQ